MRFAKNLWQIGLTVSVSTTLVGCASINELMAKMQPAKAPETKSSQTAASTPSAAPSSKPANAPTAAVAAVSAPQPVIPIVPPEPPVNPAAQRTFDEANRALKEGRPDDAERGYRSIVRSNPELGGPHANLGVIYRNANKLPEALAEFTQAVKLSPKQPLYLNQLGITYRQMGQFEKAREAYEQAIALDANYTTALLNLGILCDMYLGDSKRALELFNRYLALTPNGDATVTKWVAELKNRKPAAQAVTEKEKT